MHAIGINVVGNVTLNQTRVGALSNWKACAAGEASRKAIFAVELAQAGMTGPNQVFEGRDGFFQRINRKPFTLPQLGGGSVPFGMLHAFTKRFALGQYAQTVAQAGVDARKFFSDIGEIDQVNVKVAPIAIQVMADSPDKWRPQTRETADHSMPYAAAVAMMYGTVEEKYYEDPYLHDPRLLDLVGRVRCLPSEEAERRLKEINLCDMEIVLKSGRRENVRVEYHRGHWKNPMTDAELEEKFRSPGPPATLAGEDRRAAAPAVGGRHAAAGRRDRRGDQGVAPKGVADFRSAGRAEIACARAISSKPRRRSRP